MANISNYLEEAILNAVFRGQPFTPPAAVYVALYLNDPTDLDVGTEVSGGNYLRQQVTFSAPQQVDGKATIVNAADVEFPVATADWGLITHVGIRDAETGGNLLYYGPLENPREILQNDRLKWLAGDLVLTLD